MLHDIGKTIADIRRDMGISQEQLAEMARLNRVTVARYESGKLEPGAQALARIADALDVTTDQLLGRVEFKEKPPENAERWKISEEIRRKPDLLILFGQAKNAKPEAIKAATAVLVSLEGKQDD